MYLQQQQKTVLKDKPLDKPLLEEKRNHIAGRKLIFPWPALNLLELLPPAVQVWPLTLDLAELASLTTDWPVFD